MSTSTTTTASSIVHFIQRHIVPPLSSSFHKGEAGRIAVIGGCEEYTGAPFYASESSLRSGCDLSFVFCTRDASVPIKSYSPEIIVYPYLFDGVENEDESENGDKDVKKSESESESVQKITGVFSRLHSVVIGPGLGRNPSVLRVVSQVIEKAKEKRIPLVIDGDGLYLVSQDLSLIKGYKHAVLLPNPVEYKRIYESAFPGSSGDDMEEKAERDTNADQRLLEQLCNELGNVTIVKKGSVDIISNGHLTLKCEEKGSPRRSGGQGDVLSGITATFLHWAHWAKQREQKKKKEDNDTMKEQPSLEELIVQGCFAACMLTRRCAEEAFRHKYRSTTAPDLIQQLPHVLQTTFPWHGDEAE